MSEKLKMKNEKFFFYFFLCVKDFNIISLTHIDVSDKSKLFNDIFHFSFLTFHYEKALLFSLTLLVIIEKWKYPAPFRTWKSSTSSLIILQGPLVET
jgi:hypothetical protein